MNSKEFNLGHDRFEYSFMGDYNIHHFIITVYNTQKHQTNFYFFNMDETWCMNDEYNTVPLVITIYELQADNKVIGSSKHKIHPSVFGQLKRVIKRINVSVNQVLLVDKMNITVDQRVHLPNVSSTVFVLNDDNATNSRHIKYYVQILERKRDGSKFMKLTTTPNNEITCCTTLTSRETYSCELFKVHLQNGGQYKITHESKKLSFVTHNNQIDVGRLMNLAEKYISNNRRPPYQIQVHYLYRNKPDNHPTIINAFRTGIMSKYIKDKNGDPASSINSKIEGLFFMATTDARTGQIPDESYFGNYRIMIPPNYIVPGLNLYFADFSCLKGRSHYVTLVLSKPGSDEDKYCKNRLVKLDMINNAFFFYDIEHMMFFTAKANYLHVEILYTENIDLREMRKTHNFKEYKLHPLNVKGQSKPDGIPKKSNCTICNLSRSGIM